MSKSDTILIAVGGGEFAEAKGVFKEFLKLLGKNKDPKLAVMTVATNLPAEAAAKCNRLFRSHGVKHVDVVDISLREDAFADTSLKAIKQADALFFTGGDQLNVTSLMGGSPLHSLIEQRISDGFLVAGTSAGAAMMSSSMIASGKSDHAPRLVPSRSLRG